MTFLVEAVQEVTSLPLILDSPAGRDSGQGPEGLSLEADLKRPDPGGTPTAGSPAPGGGTANTPWYCYWWTGSPWSRLPWKKKSPLPWNWPRRLWAPGFEPENLIFDPVLPHLSWPDAYSQIGQGIHLVRLLSSGVLFKDPVRTMAGLSNLRSGQRNIYPRRVEEACLAMLAGAGLDLALINVLKPEAQSLARTINSMREVL